MEMTSKDIDSAKIQIKIIDPKKRSNSNLLATASVDFNDFFIRGFCVWQTKETNIQFVKPPCIRVGGVGWLESFVIKKKPLWQLLCKRILEDYEKASMEWAVKGASE